MKKNLQLINQNNKLMLKKSKSLMSITNSILLKDDWMQRLWNWADENNIPNYSWYPDDEDEEGGFWGGIPRTKDKLLGLKSFEHMVYYKASLILPKEFSNLKNLEEIILNGYDKIEFPKEISELGNLTKLSLIVNETPKRITYLNNLTKLNLDFLDKNRIILPLGITRLSKLKSLSFLFGNLRTVPTEVFHCKTLTTFAFVGTELDELSKEIKNLTQLRTLFLSSNYLTILPSEICKLENLFTLNISDNKLTELPKEIDNMLNLRRLIFHKNRLRLLPNKIINLTSLKGINLALNPNLILSLDQKSWIHELIENGCEVDMDDDLMERTHQTEY